MKKLRVFDELAVLFTKHGYSLYMIGGTSRDYLLDLEVAEYDLVTDATPMQMEGFLPDADFRFSHYGTIRMTRLDRRIDITTLREEASYKDYRHPQSISFVKDIEKDYRRRDFTLNAIYINTGYEVFDFCGGVDDLSRKLLRMIGEPNLRLQEDPLRILRALRFKMKYGFAIEEHLEKAIIDNADLLEFLKKEKVNDEIRKMEAYDVGLTQAVLSSYGIKNKY